ncbi:UNVERIFIED_CONTAM: hypothetical protein Slati_3930900 [Sesamum latifolium]|uniref:Retrotransposon gag domain-containing protein n=1 Tax=Sesamum latifolium TaxID=2727402 RepID=A0AAW2TP35_9LAMI
MDHMGAVERPMMEYSLPTANGTISSIALPTVQANNFEIKPSIIQIIRSSVQFSGLPEEDPNKHLSNFLKICDTFKFNVVSDDAISLRIFLFSLCDTAKDWLQSLSAGSITTWASLTQKFFAKYFPSAKTAKMLNDITSFVQLERKSLYDAWERFKGILRRCPHHELPVWRQDMKEEHKEATNFIDTGYVLNKKKRWRNQTYESGRSYMEHTKARDESYMRRKKFKDGDKRHYKNKDPIKVDWQRIKHYLEGASPPLVEHSLLLSHP